MEFRLLGAFEVWDGEQPVEIAGAKRRALLALLVLRANEVVRSELLVDELWGERPPRNAASALQTHVSRLRKTLGAETIASREWGYVLRAAPAEIDLRHFEGLVAEAEPLAAQPRAAKLAEALALWRGPPLADLVNEPALHDDIIRLEELRLSTLERRIDAELEAGNADVVGELETLVARHPLREHLRWLLILALYRNDRQAEALEVYRETRRVLTEELGLEPSPALKELEQAILRQDPSLDANAQPTHAEPPAEDPDEPSRRRYPSAALLALLALGLAGTATAIALLHPEKGTTSGTPTEAIYETLTTTTPRTDTHPKAGEEKSTTDEKHTTAPPGHHTSHSTTTTESHASSTGPPTSTGAHKSNNKHKQGAAASKPVVITDNFSESTLDPLVWNTGGGGSGASSTLANGQLVFSIAANATFDPQYHFVGSAINTLCTFPGDFEARVAFTLLQWPAANGARISLSAQQPASDVEHIERVTAPWGDGYNAYPSGTSVTRLPDQSGLLRVTRANGIIRVFFRHNNKWIKLGQKPYLGSLVIGIGLDAIQQDWQQQAVSAAFDNFVLKTPKAECPAGRSP
jgi:DNA-binding SARP family transcriptional activator